MYHHSDRKNRLFFIGYIPIQSIRFCIPKLPCGGGPCSRIISHLQCLHQMQEEAKVALQHVANTMKLYYDCNCLPSPKYQISNFVWLNLQDYSTNCPSKKLDHKWSGPFKIPK